MRLAIAADPDHQRHIALARFPNFMFSNLHGFAVIVDLRGVGFNVLSRSRRAHSAQDGWTLWGLIHGAEPMNNMALLTTVLF